MEGTGFCWAGEEARARLQHQRHDDLGVEWGVGRGVKQSYFYTFNLNCRLHVASVRKRSERSFGFRVFGCFGF